MTDLARRVSPPDKAGMTQAALRGCIVPIFTLLGVVAALLVFLASGMPTEVGSWTVWAVVALLATWLAGVLVALVKTSPEVEARFKAASRRWRQSYLCLRCGEAVIEGSKGELQIQEQGDPEIDLLLRQGQRIQAVKAMMDSTGLGLAEAKKRVDARARDLGV